MGLGRGLTWLFLRNTEIGRKMLGKETAAQQYTRQRREGLMAQAALQAWRDYQSRREADSRRKTDARGLDVHAGRSEWRDGDFLVSVADGYSRDYDRYITDILVIPTVGNPNNGRQHVGIDGNGNVLFNEWHEGK